MISSISMESRPTQTLDETIRIINPDSTKMEYYWRVWIVGMRASAWEMVGRVRIKNTCAYNMHAHKGATLHHLLAPAFSRTFTTAV